MPSFPSGTEKYQEYFKENLKYQEETREKGIRGRVFVNFIVVADGSINNIKVLRGIGAGIMKKQCV